MATGHYGSGIDALGMYAIEADAIVVLAWMRWGLVKRMQAKWDALGNRT